MGKFLTVLMAYMASPVRNTTELAIVKEKVEALDKRVESVDAKLDIILDKVVGDRHV